jgi:hypothetical protein
MSQVPMNFLSTGSKVMIAANESDTENKGLLITPFKHDDGEPKTDNQGRPIGSMMVIQHERTLNGTFVNAGRRVAFISGTVDELNNIIKQNKLKDGSEVPGKIMIRESLNPLYHGQNPKMNPSTKEEVGFTVNGKFYPVYMQQLYTPNETTEDVLIRSVEQVEAILNAKIVNTAANQHANTFKETARVPSDENAAA